MTEDDYLIWLSSIPGLGLKRKKKLIKIFGSAHDIWAAPEKLILSTPAIPKDVLENIVNYKSEKKIIAYQNLMLKNKIKFISHLSDSYPNLLKQISDYPLGFYILGELPSDSRKKISIIGSRKYTEYGAYAAEKLSYDLASRDIVIVSGMARGIDSVAHKSAIKADGKTIAVLGCGIDICYPPENNKLRDSIVNNGCLISEFSLGTRPFATNFPVRNRIISGLSNGLIVIEAGEKSGTLITVGHALEQGREVMAVPGAINSSFSKGTNYLIKQGASLISDYKDVLEIIGESRLSDKNLISLGSSDLTNKPDLKNKQTEKIFSDNNILLDKDEKLIYNTIGYDQVGFDFIVTSVDLSVNKINSCLTMLEMGGFVKKLPGQRYVRL